MQHKDTVVALSETDERALLRKVTWRLMPLLLVGYFFSFIDRSNVGVMATPLSESLGLTAATFGLAAGLFYVGYLIFEIPSNLAITRFGARIWIGRILVMWGLITISMAWMTGPNSFYILRILLGAAEAGFYPGVLFYLTLWFPRHALHGAYSLFALCVPFSLGVGAIVTSSLLLLDGKMGLTGWQWVFILEGLPAAALGVYYFLKLPARPEEASWLTPAEAQYLSAQASRPTDSQHGELSHIGTVAMKGATWIFTLLYFCMVIGFWSATYFLPRIVQERFHVATVHAGMISSMPWILAFVTIWVVSKTAKATGDRRWHMLVLLCMSGIGMLIAAYTQSPIFALVGIAMAAAGIQGSTPLFWTMPSTVFRGALAAVALALINSIGNISGLVGPWVLGALTTSTGNSRMGLYVMAGFFFLASILAFVISTHVSRQQAKGAYDVPKLEQEVEPTVDGRTSLQP